MKANTVRLGDLSDPVNFLFLHHRCISRKLSFFDSLSLAFLIRKALEDPENLSVLSRFSFDDILQMVKYFVHQPANKQSNTDKRQ